MCVPRDHSLDTRCRLSANILTDGVLCLPGLPAIFESARISWNLIMRELDIFYTKPKPFSKIALS